ncbi:hypothetical protein TESG_00040 [Trichophyton tonsurans CBS 112818]|uniref:Uncharacterized protein n=1 Tax=Trichophyton tonsurans (strain CBS 112818) TaxID=647933 RepID=F2RMB6_TRIT1|nr:hypothetical protein TESG_00040 [Trichophyton tonsurans CBS 112818]
MLPEKGLIELAAHASNAGARSFLLKKCPHFQDSLKPAPAGRVLNIRGRIHVLSTLGYIDTAVLGQKKGGDGCSFPAPPLAPSHPHLRSLGGRVARRKAQTRPSIVSRPLAAVL